MMNRKDMTASTLDETALDTYYTLTEGGANSVSYTHLTLPTTPYV